MLPPHVNKAHLVPDPSGRSGHVFHPDTDEVFSVDEETYQDVVRQSAHAPKALPSPTRSTLNIPQPKPGQPPLKFADLKKIADERGIVVKPGLSTSQLAALIEADVAAERESATVDLPALVAMAAELGVTVPEDATIEDVHRLIAIEVEGQRRRTLRREQPTFDRLMDEAEEMGIPLDPAEKLTAEHLKAMIASAKASKGKPKPAESAP